MTDLADYLGLDQAQIDELDLYDLLETNYGSSGEMPYNYYFYVPEEASPELLEQMGWKVGQLIEVPLHAIDSEDDE